jgi:hypothetical protein
VNDNVKSAGRVLDILELLFRSEEPMALKDLVAVLELPKSSAHALLRTLQSRGYVERDAADRYALSESLRQSAGWIGGPQAYLAAWPARQWTKCATSSTNRCSSASAPRAATSR